MLENKIKYNYCDYCLAQVCQRKRLSFGENFKEHNYSLIIN